MICFFFMFYYIKLFALYSMQLMLMNTLWCTSLLMMFGYNRERMKPEYIFYYKHILNNNLRSRYGSNISNWDTLVLTVLIQQWSEMNVFVNDWNTHNCYRKANVQSHGLNIVWCWPVCLSHTRASNNGPSVSELFSSTEAWHVLCLVRVG